MLLHFEQEHEHGEEVEEIFLQQKIDIMVEHFGYARRRTPKAFASEDCGMRQTKL